LSFFFYSHAPHRDLHSFPTRRSSDLIGWRVKHPRSGKTHLVGFQSAVARPIGAQQTLDSLLSIIACPDHCPTALRAHHIGTSEGDRKSTRLNSSHLVISYAVFCLKKK